MSTQKTLIGVLLGVAAGAALGVLLAPRSGKETRKLVRDKAKRAQQEIEDLLDQGHERWQQMRKRMVERKHMSKEDLHDFLDFMAAEGADLKDRVSNRGKASAQGTSATAAADHASRN
jgi:gas vesicle protein